MPTFEALWAAHVEFGTTKSHKKLLGKKRKPVESAATNDAPKSAKPTKQPRETWRQLQSSGGDAALAAAAASSAPSRAPGPSTAASDGARSEMLANKGRWGSTMAAQLLGGAGI